MPNASSSSNRTDPSPPQANAAAKLISDILRGDMNVQIIDNARNHWDVRDGGTVNIQQGISINVCVCSSCCHSCTPSRSVETFQTAISMDPDEGAKFMQSVISSMPLNGSSTSLTITPHPAPYKSSVSFQTAFQNETIISLASFGSISAFSQSSSSFHSASQGLAVSGDITFCSCTKCGEYAQLYKEFFEDNPAIFSRLSRPSSLSSTESTKALQAQRDAFYARTIVSTKPARSSRGGVIHKRNVAAPDDLPYRSTHVPFLPANGGTVGGPGSDLRASTSLPPLEELVPLEYLQQPILPQSNKRRLLSLFTNKLKQRKPTTTLNGESYVVGSLPQAQSYRETEFEGMLRGKQISLNSVKRSAISPPAVVAIPSTPQPQRPPLTALPPPPRISSSLYTRLNSDSSAQSRFERSTKGPTLFKESASLEDDDPNLPPAKLRQMRQQSARMGNYFNAHSDGRPVAEFKNLGSYLPANDSDDEDDLGLKDATLALRVFKPLPPTPEPVRPISPPKPARASPEVYVYGAPLYNIIEEEEEECGLPMSSALLKPVSPAITPPPPIDTQLPLLIQDYVAGPGIYVHGAPLCKRLSANDSDDEDGLGPKGVTLVRPVFKPIRALSQTSEPVRPLPQPKLTPPASLPDALDTHKNPQGSESPTPASKTAPLIAKYRELEAGSTSPARNSPVQSPQPSRLPVRNGLPTSPAPPKPISPAVTPPPPIDTNLQPPPSIQDYDASGYTSPRRYVHGAPLHNILEEEDEE